MYKVMFDIDH